jgi:hypothetical protein
MSQKRHFRCRYQDRHGLYAKRRADSGRIISIGGIAGGSMPTPIDAHGTTHRCDQTTRRTRMNRGFPPKKESPAEWLVSTTDWASLNKRKPSRGYTMAGSRPRTVTVS